MDNRQLRLCIDKVRNGDRKAFEEIYNDMKIPIFTIIYRIISDKERSEDIMHDLFVKLYQSPPEPSVYNPRAWIFQIARNLALNNARKPQMTELNEDYNETAEKHFSNSVDFMIDVSKAMNSLSLDEIEIVSFHIYGGMKFREISEIIQKPLGTVLWKYQKAIRKLHSYFIGGNK